MREQFPIGHLLRYPENERIPSNWKALKDYTDREEGVIIIKKISENVLKK